MIRWVGLDPFFGGEVWVPPHLDQPVGKGPAALVKGRRPMDAFGVRPPVSRSILLSP